MFPTTTYSLFCSSNLLSYLSLSDIPLSHELCTLQHLVRKTTNPFWFTWHRYYVSHTVFYSSLSIFLSHPLYSNASIGISIISPSIVLVTSSKCLFASSSICLILVTVVL